MTTPMWHSSPNPILGELTPHLGKKVLVNLNTSGASIRRGVLHKVFYDGIVLKVKVINGDNKYEWRDVYVMGSAIASVEEDVSP